MDLSKMVTKEKRASIIENMDPTIINKAHKFINYGAILISGKNCDKPNHFRLTIHNNIIEYIMK